LQVGDHAEALIFFVKACAASIYCLESLEDVIKKIVLALNVIEHNHAKKYGMASLLPHVQ